MVVAIILLALGAIMSTVFIVSKVTYYNLVTIVLMTIASLFFVALGIYCAIVAGGNVTFKALVLAGLVFGLLGDVFLGFKYTSKKHKNLGIMLGLFAFAFGHISYLVSLFIGFYVPGNVLFAILPFVTSAVITTVFMIVSKKLGVVLGKKLFPFAVFYIFCLTSMVSTAFYMNLLHQFSFTPLIMFFCGSFCFMCSDFMLTGAYFKPGQRSKPYMAIYSVFYYLAQFAIAFSLYFLL